jgi:NADPH:quinone reductase-like Zn-dependent oxidoreductase
MWGSLPAVGAGAVVVRAYGSPKVLAFEDVDLSEVAANEVRIRVLAAAVNHSDLEIRAGRWPIRRDPPFPYVPGLEAVGEVVATGAAVDSVSVGATVVTMMQGLGGVRAERDGGYAEYITVAADAIAPVPAEADPLALAALGLAAVTAYEGLRRLGPVAGMRVVVTGASGGVGSAGVVLALALDAAEVVGVVSRHERVEYVRSLGADDAIVADDDLGDSLGRGRVDRVLDTVGGPVFWPCVASLRAGGGLAAVGTVGGAHVELDANALLQPVTITGYGSESLDGAALRAAMTTICTLLAAGELAVPEVTQLPLAEAAQAHQLLEEHQVTGRIVLVPT